jgi:hypothetical protein
MPIHTVPPFRLLCLVSLARRVAPLAADAGEGEGAEGPIPVTIEKTADGYTLMRGGEPYFVRGAGGSGDPRASAAGANSVRTWHIDNAQRVLDDAHANGMTVHMGIWIGHPRHGFDYNDEEAIAEAARDGPRRGDRASRTTRPCSRGAWATRSS